MQTSWISSSKALPRDGEPVQFRVDSREIGIRGTYADGKFHSRWADYVAGKIDAWHALDINPVVVADPITDQERTGATITLLARLRTVVAGHRSIAPAMIAPIRVGTCARSFAAPAMRGGAFRPQAHDSNQMSS